MAVAVAAVRAGELPVDVDHHTGFGRARPTLVTRENPFARSYHHARFGSRKEAKRDANGSILSNRCILGMNPKRLAGQGIQQHPAHALRRQGNEFAPSHASAPGRFR
jgi:hypothetical protein